MDNTISDKDKISLTLDWGNIFIGYQGVGKSTVSKHNDKFIDLESGNFWVNGKRDPLWYIPYGNIAEHLCMQGYNVFVSSHQGIREQLRNSNFKVYIIYPALELKNQWIERLEKRFIETQKDKDYRAWKNAEEMYDQNISDLMNENTFEHIVITRIPYNLYARILYRICLNTY